MIPAFDEAARLPKTLLDLSTFLAGQRRTWEIVVSDDGSTDGTLEAARRLDVPLETVRSEQNRGKGHAVRLGMLAARGAIRVMCDADGSMPASELPALLAPLERGAAQVAIGSRYVQGRAAHGQPAWRRAWSRLVHAVIEQTLVSGIADTQCGYKAFTARAAEDIFSRATVDGWAFDLEVLAMAPRLGHRVAEVGVQWRDVGCSRVRALRDLQAVIGEAFAIRNNLALGRYR
ncbi:MAG: glycosyltransferase [Deltaproteobacteria bacterium]|nr:glycosyltransferase [Deltaproteobacteria bacterium]